MFAALTFASFFGLTEYLGLNQADAYFNCTDPAFFIVREENQLTGDKHLILKGTINTPQQGYSYRFQFINADGAYADGIVSVGQPVSRDKRFGRGLPSIQQVQVEQKFNVPQTVRYIRIRVEGLTPMPTSFICDITQTPTN